MSSKEEEMCAATMVDALYYKPEIMFSKFMTDCVIGNTFEISVSAHPQIHAHKNNETSVLCI